MRQLKISQSLTNRDSQAVEKYLQEVNKLDMITPEEEVALAIERRSHKEGSKWYNDAVESLTKANLRFVVSVAKQYQNRWLSLSDLINEGNLWLIKAAQRFDESKWFKFISYAVWRIRQSILQSISEIAGIVRMPSNKVWLYNKSVKVSNDFQQQFEREPSIEELAEIMDTDIDDIKRTILSSKRHISLDEPLWDETDSTTRADMLVSDTSSLLFGEFTSKEEQDDSVQRIIHLIAKKLSNRQSDILLSYFGVWGRKKLSYEELADKYDTSIERIRQIKEKALNLLRKKWEKMYNKTRSIMHGTENVYENRLKN